MGLTRTWTSTVHLPGVPQGTAIVITEPPHEYAHHTLEVQSSDPRSIEHYLRGVLDAVHDALREVEDSAGPPDS